jgi:hypothetical protein
MGMDLLRRMQGWELLAMLVLAPLYCKKQNAGNGPALKT